MTHIFFNLLIYLIKDKMVSELKLFCAMFIQLLYCIKNVSKILYKICFKITNSVLINRIMILI